MKTCFLGLLWFLLLSLRLVQADAGSCALLWPGGLQNTSDEGKIEFKDRGQLLGDADGLLDTMEVKNKGDVSRLLDVSSGIRPLDSTRKCNSI